MKIGEPTTITSQGYEFQVQEHKNDAGEHYWIARIVDRYDNELACTGQALSQKSATDSCLTYFRNHIESLIGAMHDMANQAHVGSTTHHSDSLTIALAHTFGISKLI